MFAVPHLTNQITKFFKQVKSGAWSVELNSAEWVRYNEAYKDLGCKEMAPSENDQVIGAYLGGKLFGGFVLSTNIERYEQYVEGFGAKSEFHDFMAALAGQKFCSVYGFWKNKNTNLLQNLIFAFLAIRLLWFVKKNNCKFLIGGSSTKKLASLYRSWMPVVEKAFESEQNVERRLFAWSNSLGSLVLKHYVMKSIKRKKRLPATDSMPACLPA